MFVHEIHTRNARGPLETGVLIFFYFLIFTVRSSVDVNLNVQIYPFSDDFVLDVTNSKNAEILWLFYKFFLKKKWKI